MKSCTKNGTKQKLANTGTPSEHISLPKELHAHSKQISTTTIEGKTPYKAYFGKKLDSNARSICSWDPIFYKIRILRSRGKINIDVIFEDQHSTEGHHSTPAN